MLETLKKKSNKSSITRIIVTSVIFVGLLIYVGPAILALLKGPAALFDELPEDPDKWAGKYVSYDSRYLINVFATKTSTDSKTKVETEVGDYYLVYDDSSGLLFGVYMAHSKAKEADVLIEQFWTCDTLEEITGSMPVKGTLTELSDKLLTYYYETIAENLGEDYYEIAAPYYIDYETIGNRDITFVYILLAALIIDLIFFLYTLIKMLSGSFNKEIRKYLTANPSLTLNTIESDFNHAHPFHNVWVGQNWTIYMKGPNAYIFANKDIIWGYYYQRTGKNAVSQIRLYKVDRKLITIDMSESTAMDILTIYGSEQPHMVTGYTKDLEHMFNKDSAAFLNLKYNPARASEFTNPSENYY